MKDVNKDYEEFWKDLVEKDGVVDMEAVKAELSDYHHVLQNVPEVYVAITGGRMSKPNYFARDVIAEFEMHNMDRGITWDDVKSMIDDYKDIDDLKLALKEYFEYED